MLYNAAAPTGAADGATRRARRIEEGVDGSVPTLFNLALRGLCAPEGGVPATADGYLRASAATSTVWG